MWDICMCVYTHTHTHTHTYNGILLSHKKESNNAICSNMDGPRVYQTKWSKLERKRQIPCDITLYVESKIWHKWTCLQNTNRLTDTENKLIVTKGKGLGGRIN